MTLRHPRATTTRWARVSPPGWLLVLVLVAALVTACGRARSTASAAAEVGGGDTALYQLSLLEDGSGWQVAAWLPPRLSRASLCAPALGTRRGESLEWLGAEADGEPAALAWDARGCFVAPRFERGLRLSYRARVEPEAAPGWRAISLSPHAEPERGGVVFPGESLFVAVEDALLARLTTARVELALPEGAVLASTLVAEAGSEAVLVADDAVALQRSVTWLEPGLARVAGAVGSGALAVSVSARLEALDAAALHARAACLAEQLDGWVVERTVAPGELLVMHAGWDQAARSGFALAGGAVLQIGPATVLDAQALDSLVAHELFHRYNGGDAGLRYAEADYEATAWFREGTTSYVAALSLVHAGLADEAQFVSLLEGHAVSYLANPARSAVDEGREPETAVQRLSYDRGVLLSLALDLMLRDVSGGRRTLRGFFRQLSRTDAWQQAQTNGSLQSALEVYAGVSLAAFFDTYVARQAAIPVSALLRQSGLVVEAGLREVSDTGMWLEYDVDNAWLRVSEVSPEGAAAAAGLVVGDVVQPLPSTRLGALEAPQGPVEFEVVRGTEVRFVRLQPSRRPVASVSVRAGESGAAPWRALLEGVAAAPSCAVGAE